MLIDLNNIVSISEANQNFSQVARRVEEDGPVVIMKNNHPRFILSAYGENPMGAANKPAAAGGVLAGVKVGGVRMLYYPNITLDQPTEYMGLMLTGGGAGMRIQPDGLDEKLMQRQTAVVSGYIALYAVRRLGAHGARALLFGQGPRLCLTQLGLPPREDHNALLAVWVYRALAARHTHDQVMALYNAYGALPGGYASVKASADKAAEGQGAILLAAVEALLRDEGDLAEKAPEFAMADVSRLRLDDHLEAISRQALGQI